jgi:hypothetical protein
MIKAVRFLLRFGNDEYRWLCGILGHGATVRSALRSNVEDKEVRLLAMAATGRRTVTADACGLYT